MVFPGKDAIVVWWGALRGAIGLALALVVYTENFRYEFSVADGGSGYNELTTSVFVVDKSKASKLSQQSDLNLYHASSIGHAKAKIVEWNRCWNFTRFRKC